jgi:multidrug efflux system membrane fusion protein
VKQGDLLAVIDPRPYQVQLEQAQGSFSRRRPSTRRRRSTSTATSKLSGRTPSRSSRWTPSSALVSQYEGMVKTEPGRRRQRAAEPHLLPHHSRRSRAGRPAARRPGQLRDARRRERARDTDRGQADLGHLHAPGGQHPRRAQAGARGATIRIDAYNRDSTVKLATGSLATIDNTVDPTTGTFKLRAVFPNDDDALFPNQFVNVTMLLDVLTGATVIPDLGHRARPAGLLCLHRRRRQQGRGEVGHPRRGRRGAPGRALWGFAGRQGRRRRRRPAQGRPGGGALVPDARPARRAGGPGRPGRRAQASQTPQWQQLTARP